MYGSRATPSFAALLLLGVVLAACGSDDSGGTTITSTQDGIVGADDEADGSAEDVGDDDGPDPAVSDGSEPAEDGSAAEGAEEEPTIGPSGTVTLDGVDHTMEQIDRCVPTDETTERIEAVDGIESLETLNLVAQGDTGTLRVSLSDIGTRSLTYSWNEDEGSLDETYVKVEGGDDWRSGEGTVPDGEPLEIVDGSAVGDVTIDGRELSFELPIPAEPSC